MIIDIATKEDLNELKSDLLKEIRSLLKSENVVQKSWLKSAEVRKILGCSSGTLQNLRINQVITPTKLGGTWYYAADQVRDLLSKSSSFH